MNGPLLSVCGGLNPVASVEEIGIETNNLSISTVMEFAEMISFFELLDSFSSNKI